MQKSETNFKFSKPTYIKNKFNPFRVGGFVNDLPPIALGAIYILPFQGK
jgi:hypothetical protein